MEHETNSDKVSHLAPWAASYQKGTYLAAQYKRVVKRMGKKKALVAIGHSILIRSC
jgi:transposase